MSLLDDPKLDKVEGPYGWCGVCHCFTEFPHDCQGEVQPPDQDPA
jgi:hypothetical protein